MTNYSAVVISANEDVKAVAPEVIRRTVICRVEAGLTNAEVMKSSIVRTVKQKICTAFYREYLRRMLNEIPDMIEQMKDEESESAPDILAVSSNIIVAIINEFNGRLPRYVRNLSLEDYFSEHVLWLKIRMLNTKKLGVMNILNGFAGLLMRRVEPYTSE